MSMHFLYQNFLGGKSDSVVGKVSTLHTTNLVLIPSIPYGLYCQVWFLSAESGVTPGIAHILKCSF